MLIFISTCTPIKFILFIRFGWFWGFFGFFFFSFPCNTGPPALDNPQGTSEKDLAVQITETVNDA